MVEWTVTRTSILLFVPPPLPHHCLPLSQRRRLPAACHDISQSRASRPAQLLPAASFISNRRKGPECVHVGPSREEQEALARLAARSALGDFLKGHTPAGRMAAKLEAGVRDNAFAYLLILRLLPAVPRAKVLEAMTWWTQSTGGSDWRRRRVQAAAFLVFASPDYQVQR